MTAVGALFDSSRLLINGPTNANFIALLGTLVVIPPRTGPRPPSCWLSWWDHAAGDRPASSGRPYTVLAARAGQGNRRD
jgi:hypothetical protein